MDKISKYGYNAGSPYQFNPYLDIKTPTGEITMENTPRDLMGIDSSGNMQLMKAFDKNPYKFNPGTVREIPMQDGGMPNPYDDFNTELHETETAEYALRNAKKLKTDKSGKFKGLIPLEYWTDDLMNYIDKFKMINRKGEKFVKVRGQVKPEYHQPYVPEIEPSILLQRGGYSARDLYNYIFDDREEETPQNAPVSSLEAQQAPEVGNESERLRYEKELQDLSDLQAAMSILADDDYVPRRKRTTQFRGASTPQAIAKEIDPNVQSATKELLEKFPGLRVTSGIRNWGDPDAHPKGRAIDLAGPDLDKAFEYYKTNIVPKYRFNPALNPKHGTGKHIHVGYYKKGGKSYRKLK